MSQVRAVSRSRRHAFSKAEQDSIELLAGLGVADDAHCGERVKHRHDAKRDPTRPNLRQVHLLGEEMLDELQGKGFDVGPGGLGENVTTRGIDLIGLPRGAKLRLGDEAVVEITGLRAPCIQIDRYRSGMVPHMLDRDPNGRLVRKVGVMGVVVSGGEVKPGSPIVVELPPEPHLPLEVV